MHLKKGKISIRKSILLFVMMVLIFVLVVFLFVNVTLIFMVYKNPAEVPSIRGYVPLVVLSDSMSPYIESGDLIVLKETIPEKVKIDDIITFFDSMSADNSTVTHRVVEIINNDGEIYFKTKGDDNNISDDFLVPSKSLIGVYCNKISGFGNVVVFMSTTKGLAVCTVLSFLILSGYGVVRKKKYKKMYDEDKEFLLSEIERLKNNKSD